MSVVRLTIPESTHILPRGYHYGAHQSGPGWSGYYVIRESDGASCAGRLSPEAWVQVPTATEIDAAIQAELDEQTAIDREVAS